jgi:hypothetical protein
VHDDDPRPVSLAEDPVGNVTIHEIKGSEPLNLYGALPAHRVVGMLTTVIVNCPRQNIVYELQRGSASITTC